MGKVLNSVLVLLLGAAIAGAAMGAAPDRARGYLEEGRKLLDRGDANGAAAQFKRAIESDPGNGEAQFDLAIALFREGDLPDLEQRLHAAQDAGYDADEVAAALADLFIRKGEYGRVLDEIPEGNRRKELESRIRTARGYAQLNLREMRDAEHAFRQGIALAQTGLAQTRIVAGDLAGAGDLLEKAVAAEPKLVDPWILLGRVRGLRNDPAGARAAFDTAVSLAPDNTVARLGRATLLINSDETQAAADVAAILDQHPDNWRANLLDATIKARHEKWREAEAALMTIPAPEQLPQALYLLARVNLARGQIDQADANITHFLALVPNDPAGIAIAAEVLAQRGKSSGAIDLLKQELAKRPNDPSLLGLLSDAYARNKQTKEAAETLDRLSEVAPRDATTRIQLAEQHLGVGQINEALDDLAIARAAAPLSPQSTSITIEALLAADRLDEATNVAEELQRQSPASPVPETYLGLIALHGAGAKAARPHFERALALQPTFATAAIDLAQTYRVEKRFDDARAVYDRVLQQDAKSGPLLMARVDLEFADHKPDDAILFLERARAADRQALPPRFRLVQAYLERREAAKAVAVARELEQIAPRDPRAISAVAEAQLANNDRQSAIANFNKVIDMTANAPAPLLRLAGVLATGGDVPAGYRLIRKALDSNPSDAGTQQAFLEFSTKTDNVGASIDFVRDLVERRPDDSSIDGLLGELYEADHKFERAEAAYRAGIAKGMSSALVRGLARSQAHGGAPEAALATLADWLKEKPDDRPAREVFAGLLQDAKQDDKAIAEYERLLSTDPKNPLLLNNLAWLYSLKSDARAPALAEQAFAIAPQSATIADTLGWILVQKGDTARGLQLLEQAAGSSPGATTHYHLAVALSKSGKREDAMRVLAPLLQSGAPFDDRQAAQALMSKLGG